MEMFLRPPVTDEYSLAAEHPDAETIRKMLCDGYDFSPERVDKAMEGFTVDAGRNPSRAGF
jgi:flap endonuclease-1